eukprot:jgi/Ulvmu1/11899/UM081_0058.1
MAAIRHASSGRQRPVQHVEVRKAQQLRSPQTFPRNRMPKQKPYSCIHGSGCSSRRIQASSTSDDSVLDMGAKYRRRALLWWPEGRPRCVLIVKKRNDADAAAMLVRIGTWLRKRGLKVLVEQAVHESETPQFDAWTSDQDIPDFCVTLGGDGTVLHTASLFRADSALPPVIAFAMGTLGFLTPFEASNFESLLNRVLGANEQAVFCTLRTRLCCEVFGEHFRVAVHHAFNEACMDRGLGNNFLRLDCYVDGSFVTTIQGDGLIVATPSGSTAYSMSAGGPMVAPSVPCMIITPIAPHSLSFRPIVVAETSDIVIHVPSDSTVQGARVTFDGKGTHMLSPRDSIRMSIAKWPLPMITSETRDQEWFVSITEKLMWNAIIKVDRKKMQMAPLPSPTIEECVVDSIDDGTLNVPSCVLLGQDHLHHTGQDINDVDDSMPVYAPNRGATTRRMSRNGFKRSGDTASGSGSDSDAYVSGSGSEWDADVPGRA